MKQKSFSKGQNSFMSYRQLPMNKNSRKRLQNVEKLGAIIKCMQKQKKEIEPQQILNTIKQKIANNYNNLYQNYEINRHEILKNIQQSQNNQTIRNNNKEKLNSVLKQKKYYDKLKAQADQKQKKLRKLQTIKSQLQTVPISWAKLQEEHVMNQQIIKKLEDEIENLNYESAVLNDMKNKRVKIKLSVKEKHQLLHDDCKYKKQKNQKLINMYYTKKKLLNKTEQKLKIQKNYEIPLTLAQQLESKLQEYQEKYTQLSILKHQTNLSKQQKEFLKQITLQEQEVLHKIKAAQQNQQKKEYQILYNHYLLCKSQDDKIKKLCKVQSITQMANNSLECQRENLEEIRQNIQNEMQLLHHQNEKLQKQIEFLVTMAQNEQPRVEISLLDLQKKLQQEQADLRKIKFNQKRKQNLMNQWQTYLNILTNGKYNKNNMIQEMKKVIKKYERLNERQKLQLDLPTVCETKQLKKNSIKNQIIKMTKTLNIASVDRPQTSLAESQQIDL